MLTALLVLVTAVALGTAAPAAALEALQPGMKAPEFSAETLDGKTVAARDLAGARAVLLVFWASWSDKSPEVLERAQKLHARFKDQGLAVVGVIVESPRSAPEDIAAARALATKLRVTFPLAVDRGLAMFSAYGVIAVPTSVLMRGDATIVGDLASYPIAGRDDFFDLVEGLVLGQEKTKRLVQEINQPNPRAVRYFNLARAMVARGLVDQVDGNLKKSIAADAGFLLPRVLLGQLYRERAVAFEAVQANGRPTETLSLSPAERDAFLTEAERMLDSALKIDPASPSALVEIAAVRAARSDMATARALLERAIAANDAFAPARAQLGVLLMRTGDADRGRAELDAALRLNPLDWRLYLTAGQGYHEAGMKREAMAHYRKGVELLWQARRELFPLSYGR